MPLDGFYKYHNPNFDIDEISAPIEGVDQEEGRYTFIPAYYKAEGVQGHWVEDKVGDVGPLLVDPRYLFDGEIKVKDEEAAQVNYRLIQKSLIRMALKWNGNDNPTDDYLEQLVDLAAKNQLPADLRIYPVRSGAEVNESDQSSLKGGGLTVFKLASLGKIDTSQISVRILFNQEARREYGGITDTENPAISISGVGDAWTVCAYEMVQVNGENILQLVVSGYFPFTEVQAREFYGEYEKYILPFYQPNGQNPYYTLERELSSANMGVRRLQTLTAHELRNLTLSSQGFRYLVSNPNVAYNDTDFPVVPLFSLSSN
jgi:hypothetical protein